jgi:hypothetical protein
MVTRLLDRLLPISGKKSWSADRWRTHLLSKAETQRERDDIIGMFMD